MSTPVSLQPLKYSLFKCLPGELGYHYSSKYYRRFVPSFEDALLNISGSVCLDLGANCGEYTRVMALKAARVIAFEPDPWTIKLLRKNVTDLNNVEILETAAGVSNQNVILYRRYFFDDNPEQYSQSSSTFSEKRNVDSSKGLEVKQIDIIQYIQNMKENIGILKMDIEGSEVEILETLFTRQELLRRIKFIFAETHERKIPELTYRVMKLRKTARRIEGCKINLFW